MIKLATLYAQMFQTTIRQQLINTGIVILKISSGKELISKYLNTSFEYDGSHVLGKNSREREFVKMRFRVDTRKQVLLFSFLNNYFNSYGRNIKQNSLGHEFNSASQLPIRRDLICVIHYCLKVSFIW